MATTPWKTSNTLIDDIKRKIAFPTHQSTFTPEDILAFINEEMMISQVPSVLSFHEEYYVTTENRSLKSNKSRYQVPDRAIGSKLRDLFWADANGNIYDMNRINSEDQAYFQSNSGTNNESIHKYILEGNDVVITPPVLSNPTGSLVFKYFIRPNQLVTDDRAAISTAFTKTITINNASIVAGNTFTIGDLVFTAVAGVPGALEFQIGSSSAETATNLTASIATDGTYSATVLTNIVTIDYEFLDTELETDNSAAIIIQTQQGIRFSSVPSNIVNSAYVDFLQTKPGHRTLQIDIKLGSNAVSGNVINFNASDIPETFVVGDYVCLQNECIIPYLPTDLHTGLAERTSARILAAQGDAAGLQMVNEKIGEIEMRQGTMLSNRVEGSPKKILNRHSPLRYLK